MYGVQEITNPLYPLTIVDTSKDGSNFFEIFQRQKALLNQQKDISNNDSKFVCLGNLSKDQPTVSHLLVSNPEYHDQCYRIINSSKNKNKPFTKLPNGKAIYLDAADKEIILEMRKQNNTETAKTEIAKADKPETTKAETAKADKTETAKTEIAKIANSLTNPVSDVSEKIGDISEKGLINSAQLASIAQDYLGVPYKDIDCFELVANGLQEMGIDYAGIKNHLTHKALNKGLPKNSYLNGEGLIEMTSDTLYKKSFTDIKNPKTEAYRVVKELDGVLIPGAIMSFSVENQGHTGIVSQNDQKWTLINSGVIDNPIGQTVIKKGVGEEDLLKEINNWFELAKSRNMSLKIGVGKLNPNKLTGYMNANRLVSDFDYLDYE